ncbi:MAG: exodeoxyribonuclease III [Oscillospiraceae bacterium]
MKLTSWNVNGLRACLTKGFEEFFENSDSDFFALQEIKMQEGEANFAPKGYFSYFNSAEKKGYSGTAIFTKHKPNAVSYGIGIDEHDHEGRVITLEYDNFFFVTLYTPNSKRELERLEYRMKWEDDFQSYIKSLDAKKPVILCGDFNVAHKEIDLKNPKNNAKNAGFTIEERNKMTQFLESGFVDTFRKLYPELTDAYSWWSYMFKAREKNAGWRIDYFLISQRISEFLTAATIHSDILGSDHCPVSIELDI